MRRPLEAVYVSALERELVAMQDRLAGVFSRIGTYSQFRGALRQRAVEALAELQQTTAEYDQVREALERAKGMQIVATPSTTGETE